MVKKQHEKKDFYSRVLSELKIDTNLSRIRKKLGISKENLNYYLRNLKKKGFINKRGTGWYEVTNKGENSTKYGNFLPKDFIRGHAYVINVKFPKEVMGWNNRIEKLEKSDINYNLVGVLKNIPRIKALGRKVWLCNDHLRIFDKKGQSYYGESATESRFKALKEFANIIKIIENKLGVDLKPYDIEFQKEHYAMIKNDLATDQNRKGVIWRIRDESGEWLLVDDSLEKGGELENVGKKAFQTNPKMQKWWGDHKKNDFKVTPSFILETMNGIQQNQLIFAENMKSHIGAVKKLGSAVDRLTGAVKKREDQKIKKSSQTSLDNYK